MHERSPLAGLRRFRHSAMYLAGSLGAVVAAFVVVGVLLGVVGRDPLATYASILHSGLGSWFAVSETLVAAAPVMLCALSVAVAARVGLMSIGAEGQLYLGAAAATYVALSLDGQPSWQVLPVMFLGACVAGGVWSGVPGFLRARFGVNETIVTLLLNYVAILFIEHLVHGPWQDPLSYGWPQTPEFSVAAELPRFAGTRLHAGMFLGLLAAATLALVLARTHVGFVTRFIGANPAAARHAHYPVERYLIAAMVVAGALAALAGFGQVSAIEGRLRTGISPGYGYTGFLVSWLGRHNPIAIVVVSILIGALLSGGDALQLDGKLPFATVNILQGCILFFLLCSERYVHRAALATPVQAAS